MTAEVIGTIVPQLIEGAKTKVTESTKMISYNNLIEFLTTKEMIISYLFFFLTVSVYYGWRQIYINKEKHYNEKEKDGLEPEINKLKIKRIILRNSFFVFLGIGLFFIWKDEIKTTFFSISFAIMAIVVLFRDVLLNILAYFVIQIGKSYEIGDVVEIKDKVGTIIDRTLMNTKILLKKEGLNSGREYIFPNSYLLTNDAIVLTRFGNYSMQFINVHVDSKKELAVTAKALKLAAEEVSLHSRERGEKLNRWKKSLRKKEGIIVPSHRPFVAINPEDKAYLTLKFACDIRQAYLIEKEILEKFYEILPFMLKEHELKLEKELKEAFSNYFEEEQQEDKKDDKDD